MKSKHELTELIKKIASDTSPVGMDAVYVHALILDKLTRIERRLDQIEAGTDGSDAGKETDN
ncbi:MAG: hypothetical protein ABGX07_02930 [Pirellulaceae bacterium]